MLVSNYQNSLKKYSVWQSVKNYYFNEEMVEKYVSIKTMCKMTWDRHKVDRKE